MASNLEVKSVSEKIHRLEQQSVEMVWHYFSELKNFYHKNPSLTLFIAITASLIFWPAVIYVGFSSTVIGIFLMATLFAVGIALVIGLCLLVDVVLFAFLCAGYIVLLVIGCTYGWQNFPLLVAKGKEQFNASIQFVAAFAHTPTKSPKSVKSG